MSDEPPYRVSTGNFGHGRAERMSDRPPKTPRWVYVFGTVIAVLILLFIVLHLAGGGFRGHMPR